MPIKLSLRYLKNETDNITNVKQLNLPSFHPYHTLYWHHQHSEQTTAVLL